MSLYSGSVLRVTQKSDITLRLDDPKEMRHLDQEKDSSGNTRLQAGNGHSKICDLPCQVKHNIPKEREIILQSPVLQRQYSYC